MPALLWRVRLELSSAESAAPLLADQACHVLIDIVGFGMASAIAAKAVRNSRLDMSKILAALAVLAMFALGACANTVRGVGKDVKQTGQAVKDVAQ